LEQRNGYAKNLVGRREKKSRPLGIAGIDRRILFKCPSTEHDG
jgi:hypothetical protein